MTQRTFLTSVVLTAATGQFFAQPDLAFGLIHSLTGRRAWSFTELRSMLSEVRSELVGQFPWLADLDVPDLYDAADPRATRWDFVSRVAAEHGAMLDVAIAYPVPEVPEFTIPRRVTLVRLPR